MCLNVMRKHRRGIAVEKTAAGGLCRARWRGQCQLRLAAAWLVLERPLRARNWAYRAVGTLERSSMTDRSLADALTLVAACCRSLGRLEEASAAQLRAMKVLQTIAPDSLEPHIALIELADLHRSAGHYDSAEAMLLRALDAVTESPVEAQPLIKADILNALGIVCKDTGRYAEAEQMYNNALGLLTRAQPPDKCRSASVCHNLAGLDHARGRPEEALPAAANAVRLREQTHGSHHRLLAQDLAVLGACLLELGRLDEAEDDFERAMSIVHRQHPPDPYEVAVLTSNLAVCCHHRGDHKGAEVLLTRALQMKHAVLGPQHPEIARQLNNLAVAVAVQGRFNEANQFVRRAVRLAERTIGPEHPLTRRYRNNVRVDSTTERSRPVNRRCAAAYGIASRDDPTVADTHRRERWRKLGAATMPH
jgi:tetratricopeptide (TPR) repeat protein